MYYGYDFNERNGGGLGAIIHDVMNAYKYAKMNNLLFCFTKEGYEIPRLNGATEENADIPNKQWDSYFQSIIPIVEKENCAGLWPIFLPDTQSNKWSIQEYADIINNDIFILNPETKDKVNELVKNTAFCEETDIVLHIRRTDKTAESNSFLPFEIFIKECEYVLYELNDEKNRIYICTDDKSVCETIRDHFHKKKVEVVWDTNKNDDFLHEARILGTLSNEAAYKETMNSFKNLMIMKRAVHLVGGRMSYFFRIGELLRYPKKTTNVQDNDLFGIAPYSGVGYMIRPYRKMAIHDFINPLVHTTIEKYADIYKKEGIVTVPDFISESVLEQVKPELENYKWWCYATMPNNNEWVVKYFSDLNDPILGERFLECGQQLENRQFCYRFKRDVGGHYAVCNCVACRLYATIQSFPVTDMLCKIVGCRNLIPGEMFLSNYGKNDFISIHHDINKGDIAVTFSLSSDWSPVYGGILHFCDGEKNIYKSIVPKLGSVNIFGLDPENGLDHFVSTVNVDKNRYTLTAWYTRTWA